jgi:superfamily II DNA or RNA helicase
LTDIVLHKLNESFIKIECEKHFAQELFEFFSFRVPNFQFTPAYKNKLWDGYIRLFNLKTYTIYTGLLSYIEQFCKERNYKVTVDTQLKITENFSINEAKNFISDLKLPFEVRDYQLNSFVHAIRNKRMLLVSPTASGKSLIIYLIVRYLSLNHKKGLLIVPNVSLVSQMFKDFQDYSVDNGFDVKEFVHTIYQGRDKNSNTAGLYISTWQSIFTQEKEYFEQFEYVIGDEAHLFKAKSLTTILTGCDRAIYRIGATGSLDGTQTHKLVLEGLFGPVSKSTTTSELIEKGQLADFSIKCLVLKYPEEICVQSKKWDYDTEINYIISNQKRNDFIKNLCLSLNGNSLVLFQFVEKHGKILYELILQKSSDRKVFFVYGGTDVDVRESVREIVEKETNAIIVASYGVFSTGVNIRNLHNIIFASPSKSRIRNLQSIGRGLRKGDNKEKSTLFDIADDFRVGKHTNFTLKHLIERIKIYDEEKFNYKFYNIEIKI